MNEQSEKKMKLTKLERFWILYDVANSAFVLLVATLLPIYFNSLAEAEGMAPSDYLAWWGYGASAATLLVAFLGPVLGTIADTKGLKKPLFLIMIVIGAVGCAALGFFSHWVTFLIVYVVAKAAYSGSLVLYDAMLTDVTTPERMDHVSSQGYGWGYIGSCIPFLIGLGLVLGADAIGITMGTAMVITFLLIAVWWIALSLPLLRRYRQIYYVERPKHVIRSSFSRIGSTLRQIRKQKHIFLFLLAFFFYIDGVYTIIDMAMAYGDALGFDSTQLLLALLATQVVALPSSVIFGRLTKKYSTRTLITVCIIAYAGIAVFAFFLSQALHFWILAILVGMFQGGIQALSRSYFAKIIPAENAGEYFGLFDICGKGASFLGTTLVGIVSQVTDSMNMGVSVLVVVFLVGLVIFRLAPVPNETAKTE